MKLSRNLGVAGLGVLLLGLGAVAFVATSPANSAVEILFRVSVWDDTAMDWELRWVGTPSGPALSGPEVSPETTAQPFVGFARRFRVEWEATSANGPIAGYRYLASQNPGEGFLPEDVGGIPQFDGTGSFEFDNSVPSSAITPGQCGSGWSDCPELLRFASGVHLLRVQAIDSTGATNDAVAGELFFSVNYPPVTELNTNGGFPAYWDGATWISVADGDTVPNGSYLVLKAGGLDRLERNVADLPPGLPCCDSVLDPLSPEVRFQARVALLRGVENGDGRIRDFASIYGPPELPDTTGILVGPFESTVALRTMDEHDRRDPEPVEFSFVGGFQPRMIGLQPPDGLRLLARNPIFPDWPENEIPYQFSDEVTLYWDPGSCVFEESDGPGRLGVEGRYLLYPLRFEAAADPREPQNAVRSFSYALFNESDPSNLLPDGPIDSPDLSFFGASPVANVWDLAGEPERPKVFVPNLLWSQPDLFDQAGDPQNPLRAIGTAVARQLREWTLRVRGRTTKPGDAYFLYAGTRPGPGAPTQLVDLEKLGRTTGVAETRFTIELGLDPTFTGSVAQVWPPESFDLDPPRVTNASSVAFDELIVSFDDELDAASVVPDNFRVYVTDVPSDRPEIVLTEIVGLSQVRLRLDRSLGGGKSYTLAYVHVADVFANKVLDWSFADLSTAVDIPDAGRAVEGPTLHRNRPNPFNPRTTIDFELPHAGQAKLELFDVAGRRVRVLVDEWKAAGPHETLWDGTDQEGRGVASGVYLARLSGFGGSDAMRLVLVR